MSRVVDFVALSLLPLHWWRDAVPLLRAGHSPGDLLETLLDKHPEHSQRVTEIRERAHNTLARASARGIAPLVWDDRVYPPLLAAISDPPPVLWIAGSPDSLSTHAIAIVGSRAGSDYALQVAARLAEDLAARDVVIVSGLARGVDSAAHRGALESGRTVAVLGCGADIVYPAEHKGLARAVMRSGAIVSELAPGTRPRAQFFPRRNRIISGLCRATVIVEAGEKSGSLITARCALEQGRDVLAVPGNVLNGRNRGGHALLRDGAKIVESADDILEELRVPVSLSSGGRAQPAAGGRDPVLESLPAGEACDLDLVATRTGLTPSRLLPRLLELELLGFVARAGGGRFVRVDRTC